MKLAFLGTASASVTAERDNTYFFLQVGDTNILIDCGGNPAGKLLKLGLSPNELDIILLTHLQAGDAESFLLQSSLHLCTKEVRNELLNLIRASQNAPRSLQVVLCDGAPVHDQQRILLEVNRT